MDSIHHILTEFETIMLQEAEDLNLMNRTDTKFIFNLKLFPAVLEELKNSYTLAHVDGKLINRYQTTYFDTEGFDLYHAHHNGKLNRYKVRHRTYLETNLSFLEVKYKNNKGQTLKIRTEEPSVLSFNNSRALRFLEGALPFSPLDLAPKIRISYRRLIFFSKTSAEKLTLDLNLAFESDHHHKALHQLVVAEIKQNGKLNSPFISVMKKQHIQETSFSKYCIGVASLFHNVKKNNFKKKLLTITKLSAS